MSRFPRRPLRFCMVTTFYPPYAFGGDAVFVERLSHELAGRGHEVDVVHCADAFHVLGGKTGGRAPREHPRIRVHTLKSPAGWLWPLAMQQTGGPAFHAGKLRALLERDYDVIHYHNVSLIGGPDVLRYGRAVKLYTMHEYWLVCPMHILFRDNREPCTEPHCLRCTLAHRRLPQPWRATGKLKDAARQVDVFLALSKFSIEMHRARGLEGDLRLLPPFAARPEAAPEAAEKPVPYFLFAGRLEALKGLHTLIPDFVRHSRAELWIAGTGSQEAALKRLAAGHARVRFLGHVEQPRLAELYRGAIAVIVPSLCYEGFPLVVAEALSAGAPLVVRRLGSLPELVEDTGAGLAYSGSEELAAALRALHEEPELRRRMSARAMQYYERDLTPEAHLERYFLVIEELLGKR